MNKSIRKGMPLLFFFFLSLVALLFASPDSYLHDHLLEHWDVAWFYTCGKAWMNGMTPYVDFADSKGPLLWLIYGIGYLLTPRSYLGVFWLSVLLYTGVFYYIYKTAYLFLKDKKKSLAVVLLMTASYFCAFYHNEVRAEDWCQLFIAVCFYRTCTLLYTEEGKRSKELHVTCFLLGIGCAGALLIKYNITIMLGGIACYVLYVLIREKRNITIPFLYYLGGVCIVMLPFLLYMIYAGNLHAFIQEYFINTLHTQDDKNTLIFYIQEWISLVWDPYYIVLFAICIIGALMMSQKVNKDKWFFLLTFIGFYAIALHNCGHIVHYYLCICLFFPVWFCITIAEKYRPIILKATIITALLFTFIGNHISFGYITPNQWFKDTQMRQDRYAMAWYMSQIEKPTIIYFKSSDIGLGIFSEALPGTKYWAYQGGATTEMASNQIASVKSGSADFIYTNDHDALLSENDIIIRAAGYEELYHGKLGLNDYKFYSRHKLLPPPDGFHVGRIDILFKRSVLN